MPRARAALASAGLAAASLAAARLSPVRLFAARLAAASLLAASLLTGCSPYDPSLPGTPFLCGDTEPRCPDGYVCVGEPDGRKVCHAAGSVPDAGLPDSPAPTAAPGP